MIEKFLYRIFLFSGAVLLTDLAIFGPGLVIPGLGLQVRRIFLVLALLAAALWRLTRRVDFTRAELLLGTLMVSFVLLWAWLLPSSRGFVPAMGIADVSPWFVLFALVVWPWSDEFYERSWSHARRLIIALGMLLALLHVLLWVLLTLEILSPAAIALASEVLFGTNMEGESFIRVALDESGQVRVFWTSSMFLMATLYFLIAYRPKPRNTWWYVAICAIVFALWTTQIRAFLGTLLICAVAYPVLLRVAGKRAGARQVILGAWLAAIFFVSVAIDPVLLQQFGLSRDVSDVERADQAAALLQNFSESPLIGNGFGSFAASMVRSDDAPFSYELVFYALLMKIGLVGVLVLGTLLFISLGLAGANRAAERRPKVFAFWTSLTAGLWFAAGTNPMVTNFVGMMVVLLFLVDLRVQGARATDKEPVRNRELAAAPAMIPAARSTAQ